MTESVVIFDTCILLNSRSIFPKRADLYFLLDKYHPKILAITETWLCDFITDSSLIGDFDYSVIRRDRPNRQGGGVLFLVHSSVQFIHVDVLDLPDHVELLCLDLLCAAQPYRFILCYRPSDVSVDDVISSVLKCMRDDRTCILLGDFNLPDIDWKSPFSCNLSNMCSVFVDFICTCGFMQYVFEATRGNNVLDLVFCSLPNIIHSCRVGELFSDHRIVFFNLAMQEVVPSKGISFIDFRNGSYDDLKCMSVNRYFCCLAGVGNPTRRE